MLYNIITEPICPVCKKLAVGGATHYKCQTKYSLDGLIFFWRYQGSVHKIIHKIKYNPFIFTAIEEIVSHCIDKAQNPALRNLLSQKPILIPVPLHSSRLRYRGYNHAEKIARAFGKNWNLNVVDNLLIRTKNTKPQSKLNLEERRQNIKNAFFINHNTLMCKCANTPIILVDDVWTTGSTLSECCKVLKKKGARSVWALTLAR